MANRTPFRLTVASPCTRDWKQMKGTDQKRFCEGCRQHVYDLSAMRWDEVKVLTERADPPCVRFFQRADGTVMTADCPVQGWRARRRVVNALSALTALVLVVLGAARNIAQRRLRESCPQPAASSFDVPRYLAALKKTPPEPTPADDKWMEERRARLSGGQPQAHQGMMLGVIRGTQVIRAKD